MVMQPTADLHIGGSNPGCPQAKNDEQKCVPWGERPLVMRPPAKSGAQKCVCRGLRSLMTRPRGKSDAQNVFAGAGGRL